MEYTLEYLKTHPVFWTRLGFCYDPPISDETGAPLVFNKDFTPYMRYQRTFADAGVKVFTSILHSGWVGVDTYDYSLADRVVEAVFRDLPEDACYIPRIKLNPPIDWCRENPAELFVYEEGPREEEAIRALVGTLKQDILGYEAPNGYYVAEGYHDPRPNVGGLIGLQSFSSEKWRQDAGVALQKIIDRLENGPYGRRILGYHIAFGACGESMLWGRQNFRYGDFGIANRAAFYRYACETYGSPAGAAAAWGEEPFTAESITIPNRERRTGKTDDIIAFMRGREADRLSVDYDRFMSGVTSDAILHFAAIAKKTGKLVGCFYGYYLHIDNAAYTGHLAVDRLLDSPYIDFLAAPKSYYHCGYGQPGGEMTVAQSVNRKKLWVDELDNRSYLANDTESSLLTGGKTETYSVMWREFAKNLAHDSGFWWMDLGGGWFDAPDMMAVVGQMVRVNAHLRTLPHRSLADVLIVVDERSCYYARESQTLRRGFVEDFIQQTAAAGALSDICRAADLPAMDLSPYRLIVFACNWAMEEEDFARFLASAPADATILFQYAAGIRRRAGVDLAHTAAITGYTLLPDGSVGEGNDLPVLRVARASHDPRRLLNLTPYLPAASIRAIAEKAGCRLYTDRANAVLYADNRFACLSPFGAPGMVTFAAPTEEPYRDMISGRVYDGKAPICVDMTAQPAAFLVPLSACPPASPEPTRTAE